MRNVEHRGHDHHAFLADNRLHLEVLFAGDVVRFDNCLRDTSVSNPGSKLRSEDPAGADRP